MTIVTTQYVRKPLYVDAVKVTEANFVELSAWCQGEIRDNAEGVEIRNTDGLDPLVHHIRVRVHNPKTIRQTQARVGDWILYTERGYKVYTQRAFVNSFDPANGNGQAEVHVDQGELDADAFSDGEKMDAADVGEVQT